MPSKEQFIKDLISRMTLEQKVGGCITFEFCGTRITPNEYRKINEFQVAGLRTTPHIFTEEPYGSRHDAAGTSPACASERIWSDPASQRISTFASLRSLAIMGRNSAAISRCTSTVSSALHTDGRCTLALNTISTARSSLAEGST